jgi:DnaD/phage-associated family protein
MTTPTTPGFIGFPDVKMKPVIVPDYFFSELLPQIDDLAELKVTLHCFWLLNAQEGELRYLRGDDLREDAILLRSLRQESDLRTPQAALEDALQRAVARNTLLKLEIETDAPQAAATDDGSTEHSLRSAATHSKIEAFELSGGGSTHQSKIANPNSKIEDWYFINTVKGRQTLALIRQGKFAELHAAIPEEARLRVKRPNIFVLYEQNIGLMTPLIADQLRDLERTYPPDWVDEAFSIAVSRNRRNLRYIQTILKRWETEGKDPESHEDAGRDSEAKRRRNYLPDEFSDVILG